ncbi:MAG: hypothetical protein ACRCRZ_00115 [Metamycoplasmataceae bacterium]
MAVKNEIDYRQYSCTWHIDSKTGGKYWIVLEDGKKWYRRLDTQTEGIEYFRELKTYAKMRIQSSKSKSFSRNVITKLAQDKYGTITAFEVVLKKELKKRENTTNKKETKKSTNTKKSKPSSAKKSTVVKSKKTVIKKVDSNVIHHDNTITPSFDSEIKSLDKFYEKFPEAVSDGSIIDKSLLKEEKKDEQQYSNNINTAIIDEILLRNKELQQQKEMQASKNASTTVLNFSELEAKSEQEPLKTMELENIKISNHNLDVDEINENNSQDNLKEELTFVKIEDEKQENNSSIRTSENNLDQNIIQEDLEISKEIQNIATTELKIEKDEVKGKTKYIVSIIISSIVLLAVVIIFVLFILSIK